MQKHLWSLSKDITDFFLVISDENTVFISGQVHILWTLFLKYYTIGCKKEETGLLVSHLRICGTKDWKRM